MACMTSSPPHRRQTSVAPKLTEQQMEIIRIGKSTPTPMVASRSTRGRSRHRLREDFCNRIPECIGGLRLHQHHGMPVPEGAKNSPLQETPAGSPTPSIRRPSQNSFAGTTEGLQARIADQDHPMRVICSLVGDGAEVTTDCWSGCNALAAFSGVGGKRIAHRRVDHSVEFVTADGCHTNVVECMRHQIPCFKWPGRGGAGIFRVMAARVFCQPGRLSAGHGSPIIFAWGWVAIL